MVPCLLALTLALVPAGQEPLFPNADFEQGTLEGWTVAGEAFATQPTRGDNPVARGREAANAQGRYWIGGYERCTDTVGAPGESASDALTGTLTSRAFTVTRRYVTFRIGGGCLPGEVGVRLLCEGRALELATGVDAETMIERSVDVLELLGKEARLEVYDHATGGWGHVNVDAFTATDEPVPAFAFTEGIPRADDPAVGYDQPLRPQFHFTARTGWINDPNGLVFDGERYHLFFQHNPAGTSWGNMTWGHATSPDLVHWTQGAHALLPYRVDGQVGTIFSGTAVIDRAGSIGVPQRGKPTLCAFFTFATKPAFYQALATSTDGGATFTYWNEGRAVVPNQGFDPGERDPKVFWHEPTRRWVMALWVHTDPGRVRWFTSTNLIDWQLASDLMRDWAFECMDVYSLPLDGDPARMRCVVSDASFDYEVGSFDGTRFVSSSPAETCGRGNFYAAQTFNQAPGGRVIQIGWMRGPNAAEAWGVPFNQQMSFPCELSLHTTPEGPRLFVWPVAEIAALVADAHTVRDLRLAEGVDALAGLPDLDLVDLDLEFEPGTASALHLDLPRVALVYDTASGTLTHSGVDDAGQPRRVVTLDGLVPRDGVVTLRLLVDRLSVEAYAFGGERFGAHCVHPSGGAPTPSLRALGGEAVLRRLVVRRLTSAWTR